MLTTKLKGHAAMVGANLSWGLMTPLAKMVMNSDQFNAWMLVSFRVGGAALLFWITSLFLPKEKVSWRDKGLMLLAALLGIILNQGVFTLGISYTSPISASIVTTTLPIITMIIAAWYLKEPITLVKAIGVIVGGAGAVLLILNSSQSSATAVGAHPLLGIFLCLFAQFCYALYFVLFFKLIKRYSPVTLMKWMFLFGALVYLPFNLRVIGNLVHQTVPLNLILDIAFVVVAGTFLSYLLIPIGQKFLRPTVATMYNNVQPVVATIAAIAWKMDSFGILKALAICLVFSGVYIVTRSRSRE